MAKTDSVTQASKFLKTHHGREVFAPFTGQDARAWRAFVALLELYTASDERGCTCAVTGMRAALEAMQPSTRWVAKATIPALLDWGDEGPLWAILEGKPLGDPRRVGLDA